MGSASRKKRVIEALTEEQAVIIFKGTNEDYPLEESTGDIDLIADLSVLKMKVRERGVQGNKR